MTSSPAQTPAAGFTAAAVIGMLLIFVNVSLAALIFKGPLNPYLGQGISLMMAGTLALLLVTAQRSSLSGSLAVVQEAPVGILAVLSAHIVRDMAGAPSDQVFATVLGAIFVSTLTTGAFFWLLGRFNLGQLVRFVPYPVIGGFLAGTGWLLVTGAIQVMTHSTLGQALFGWQDLVRWAPGVLFGIVALWATRRSSHFLVMPALVLGGIALFYTAFLALSGSATAAMADGWLLGPLPTGPLWRPEVSLAIPAARWETVFRHHGPSLAAIPLISALALLLNVTALEVALEKDADLNRELRAAGLANALAALLAGPVGFAAVSETVLGQRLGGRSSLFSYLLAGMLAAALLVGAGAIAYVPRMVAGGLLFFLGLSFLVEWLYDSWGRFSKIDYGLIWLILLAIAGLGFLEGVALGILLAAILFVVNYSRIDAVRRVYSRMGHEGPVMRKPADERVLRQRGDAIVLVELQGFLFFGTAHRLAQQLLRLAKAERTEPLRYLLVDFRLVTGMDSSVGLSFNRMLRQLHGDDVTLVLTALSPAALHAWRQDILVDIPSDWVSIFPTLDEGLVWCERQLLSFFAVTPVEPDSFLDLVRRTLTQRLHAPAADLTLLRTRLKRIEAAAGERILQQDEPVPGILYMEAGEVAVKLERTDEDGSRSGATLRYMEAGTILGEVSYYTRGAASASIEATRASRLTLLAHEDLAALEHEAPLLALAVHHILGRDLSDKLIRDSRMIDAVNR